MTTTRILTFQRRRAQARGEPVSPFRHLMPARPLTPREILHRRRMMDVFGNYLLTRVNTDSEYKVKSFPGSASSNRSTNVLGPVSR